MLLLHQRYLWHSGYLFPKTDFWIKLNIKDEVSLISFPQNLNEQGLQNLRFQSQDEKLGILTFYFSFHHNLAPSFRNQLKSTHFRYWSQGRGFPHWNSQASAIVITFMCHSTTQELTPGTVPYLKASCTHMFPERKNAVFPGRCYMTTLSRPHFNFTLYFGITYSFLHLVMLSNNEIIKSRIWDSTCQRFLSFCMFTSKKKLGFQNLSVNMDPHATHHSDFVASFANKIKVLGLILNAVIMCI